MHYMQGGQVSKCLQHLTSTHMAYTTPVNALYETGPQTPMVPMLMLQTEFISTTNPSSILTQEVPHWSKTPILQEVGPQPQSQTPIVCGVQHRSWTPIVQEIFSIPSPISHHRVWFQSESANDSDSISNQLGASIASDSDSDGLIPKPHGEVKRPSHGGYTLELELTLNWDKKYFCQVQVCEMFIYSPHLLTWTLEIHL